MYKATTPPLSVKQGEELGRWLNQYAIRVSGLEVWHILRDGRRVRDDPLRDTVVQAGGSMGTGGTAGAGLAAAGFTLALSPFAMVAMVASLPVLIRGIHENNKSNPGGRHCDKVVSSELSFDLVDVSPKRRRWAEYLLSIYAAKHQDWRLTGLVHPEQSAVGAAYAASHAGYPPPWGGDTPSWATDTTPRTTTAATTPTSGGRVKNALRDLW